MVAGTWRRSQKKETHLTGPLPEDFRNHHKLEVLQLLSAPLRVPCLILKVQFLSQGPLQVLPKPDLNKFQQLCSRLKQSLSLPLGPI